MRECKGGRAYLDRSVSVVGDFDSDPLATVVDHDPFVFDYDSTRESLLGKSGRIVCWK